MAKVIVSNPLLKRFDQVAIQTSRQSTAESLVMMNPQNFLKLANPLRKYAHEKHKRVKKTLFQGGKFKDLPYLKIEKRGEVFKVIGHEGRHRTTYLPLLYPEGSVKMPVRFIAMNFEASEYFGKWVTIEAQMGSEKLKIRL